MPTRRLLSLLHAANLNSNASRLRPGSRLKARLTEAYGKLPLYFEPNLGQAPGGVRYLTRTPGATILLRDTEAVIQLRRAEAEGQDKRAIVRMRLAGAVAPRRVEPLEKLPGISNYFVGRDPKQWRTDIPQYQRVRYEQVYPGVDLVYYGNGPQLQYDFTVEPGADAGEDSTPIRGDGGAADRGVRRSVAGDGAGGPAAGEAGGVPGGGRRARDGRSELPVAGRGAGRFRDWGVRPEPAAGDRPDAGLLDLSGGTSRAELPPTATVWRWMRGETPTSSATLYERLSDGEPGPGGHLTAPTCLYRS